MQDQGRRILTSRGIDFLYERYSLFGWGGAMLAHDLDVPLVLEINAPLCDQQDGYEKFTFTGTARGMEGRILEAADAIVAMTPWLEAWAQQRGTAPSRIVVLPDACPSVSSRNHRTAPTCASAWVSITIAWRASWAAFTGGTT
jgi:hypothetical protein